MEDEHQAQGEADDGVLPDALDPYSFPGCPSDSRSTGSHNVAELDDYLSGNHPLRAQQEAEQFLHDRIWVCALLPQAWNSDISGLSTLWGPRI